jgi:hypothetical protein
MDYSPTPYSFLYVHSHSNHSLKIQRFPVTYSAGRREYQAFIVLKNQTRVHAVSSVSMTVKTMFTMDTRFHFWSTVIRGSLHLCRKPPAAIVLTGILSSRVSFPPWVDSVHESLDHRDRQFPSVGLRKVGKHRRVRCVAAAILRSIASTRNSVDAAIGAVALQSTSTPRLITSIRPHAVKVLGSPQAFEPIPHTIWTKPKSDWTACSANLLVSVIAPVVWWRRVRWFISCDPSWTSESLWVESLIS